MSIIMSLVFALAIGFTGSASQVTEAPVQAAQVQQIVQHDPILEMDAATTLSDYGVNDFNDDKGNHYTAQYIGTDESSDSMYGEFTYESIDFPGAFHHYKYSILKSA
jgi:hypothetical protein